MAFGYTLELDSNGDGLGFVVVDVGAAACYPDTTSPSRRNRHIDLPSASRPPWTLSPKLSEFGAEGVHQWIVRESCSEHAISGQLPVEIPPVELGKSLGQRRTTFPLHSRDRSITGIRSRRVWVPPEEFARRPGSFLQPADP
jgi:hypothetical protein